MASRRTFSDKRIEELKARPIDLSDIPEVTEEMWKTGRLKNWKPAKKPVTVRLDLDNLEWLKGRNPKGYQTRLNDALRWARKNGYHFH